MVSNVVQWRSLVMTNAKFNLSFCQFTTTVYIAINVRMLLFMASQNINKKFSIPLLKTLFSIPCNS